VIGSGGAEVTAFATLDGAMALSAGLETQALVYNPDPNVAQAAKGRIRSLLSAGKKITANSLKARESYQIIDLQEGQTGVTYAKLFGRYLVNSKSIRITDPYIRQDFQARNLEELLNVVADPQRCVVELVTMYEKNARYGVSEESRARARLDALKERLEKKGILFSYSFDPHIHDRFVETEDWQIILGRGLDFYHPPDAGKMADYQRRRTRKCQIVVLPKNK
jgi:hypothetical protein